MVTYTQETSFSSVIDLLPPCYGWVGGGGWGWGQVARRGWWGGEGESGRGRRGWEACVHPCVSLHHCVTLHWSAPSRSSSLLPPVQQSAKDPPIKAEKLNTRTLTRGAHTQDWGCLSALLLCEIDVLISPDHLLVIDPLYPDRPPVTSDHQQLPAATYRANTDPVHI